MYIYNIYNPGFIFLLSDSATTTTLMQLKLKCAVCTLHFKLKLRFPKRGPAVLWVVDNCTCTHARAPHHTKHIMHRAVQAHCTFHFHIPFPIYAYTTRKYRQVQARHARGCASKCPLTAHSHTPQLAVAWSWRWRWMRMNMPVCAFPPPLR